MSARIGLGPVFAFDWLVTSRRWQVYAVRAAFVFALLLGLYLVSTWGLNERTISARGLASVGESFFQTMVGIQFALILLAAPAATAGALCLDKSRGTLAHLLVTDLSDPEIVLGKLASRLIPVLGFLLCPLPVLGLASLLGGIDPVGLVGASLVCLGLAIFGCSLALFMSVWASKTHESLMATYAVVAIWLLSDTIWGAASWTLFGATAPAWLYYANPFNLTFLPSGSPASDWLLTQAVFTGLLVLAAAIITTGTVLRMRPVAVRQLGGRQRESKRRLRMPGVARLVSRAAEVLRPSRFISPSLDGNPVLWREWHRQHPSRWLKAVWMLFFTLSTLLAALALFSAITAYVPNSEFGALVVAFSVSIGLLLVAIGAPTSLAEERSRGSLDVLMSTPLSTLSIVWGKWCGAYRVVPAVAVIPVLLTTGLVLNRYPDRFLAPILMLTLILAQGAVTTSIGLLLATCFSRLGRALVVSITIYLTLTVGLVMLMLATDIGDERAVLFSPFWGPGILTIYAEQDGALNRLGKGFLLATAAYSVLGTVLAAILLGVTSLIFDRRLGRVAERQPSPSRNPSGRWTSTTSVALQ